MSVALLTVVLVCWRSALKNKDKLLPHLEFSHITQTFMNIELYAHS